MIRNYLKIAWRNLLHHKAFSILNIAGLATGMACSILILLWVDDELSFDKFHANANQLFRLVGNAGDFRAAVSPAGMGEGLQQQLPEIRAVVRLSKPSTNLFEASQKKFEEKRVFFADSNFLQVFSFPLLRGDSRTALQTPEAVLITEAMAKKYFGSADPLGKVLRRDNYRDCIVTGVLANVPANSHLQFDFILPMSSIVNEWDDLKNRVWGNFNFYTYLQLDPRITPRSMALDNLQKRILAIYKVHNPGMQINFQLQPLTEIHLHSNLQIDVPGHGNMQYVNIFFIVALFIIAVACINFMNLATARSSRRAREVGLRKVVGARRFQLVSQFLGESLLISIISLLLAVGVVMVMLPYFNNIAGKELSFHLANFKILAGLIGIAIVTGLLSGSYPALFLSGFQPIRVLKGTLSIRGGNLFFRNALVVTQFVVSIILLIGTAVVYKQLNYIRNKDLGFDKSNLLYMPMTGDLWHNQDALKTMLRQNPGTAEFSFISDLPTSLITGSIDVEWKGKDPRSQVVIPSIYVDENFVNVFKLRMLTGRGFSARFRGDSSNFVLNETAMRLMGMKPADAVGSQISFDGVKGSVVGVVRDFNFKSLQYAIEPLVLRFNRWGGIVVVRTPPGNTRSTIASLEKLNTALNPAYPFTFSFIDKDLDNLYHNAERMGSIFKLFAILAIFISCLGLYGLSAFMAEQRVREIGVRKVLGASVLHVVYLLSASFTKLIVVSILLAVPLSWFAISNWLNGFAYRVEAGWSVFLLASGTALLIAWLTVSYESIKAALANPVKALHAE